MNSRDHPTEDKGPEIPIVGGSGLAQRRAHVADAQHPVLREAGAVRLQDHLEERGDQRQLNKISGKNQREQQKQQEQHHQQQQQHVPDWTAMRRRSGRTGAGSRARGRRR